MARLGATGTLLGAFTGVHFEERTARWRPDSLLFLYTDGLTEARSDGELYGEERLFAHLATEAGLSTDQVVRDVVADVCEFSGDHLRDDLAILALKLVPPTGRAVRGAARRGAAEGEAQAPLHSEEVAPPGSSGRREAPGGSPGASSCARTRAAGYACGGIGACGGVVAPGAVASSVLMMRSNSARSICPDA